MSTRSTQEPREAIQESHSDRIDDPWPPRWLNPHTNIVLDQTMRYEEANDVIGSVSFDNTRQLRSETVPATSWHN